MPTLERIRDLYPEAPPAADAARERARLALAVRIDRRTRRRLGRRMLAPAAGVACVAAAAAVALVGFGDEGVVDARAAAVLRDAAAQTRGHTPVRQGAAVYARSINAHMATWAEAGFSVLVPQRRETWIENGRMVIRTTSGTPRFLSERDRARWIAAGRPPIREGGGVAAAAAQGPSALPSDPDALYAAIEDEARGHSEGTHRQMFTRVGDYLREAAESPPSFSPAQRAALYEVAARIPGIELIGPVRDPVGRKGVAVAMAQPSDGLRHTLVIDRRRGRLLAEEQVTLADNFHGYPAGTVVGHSTFLQQSVGASRPGWAQLP